MSQQGASWLASGASTPELAQSLVQEGQHIVRIPATDDATRLRNRLAQAMTAIQRGDYDGSLVHWARIVGLDPKNARARFFYGAALWQATRAKDIDHAIKQLEEACSLEPNWDRPFVEIAIIWLNRGQPEMALHHLEGETAGFRESSDHYNWQLGVALRQLDRFDEALAAFERATDLNPQHAAAWDFAADCAFQLDQKLKGRRYAKQAFDLGRDTSYRVWVT